MPNAVRRLRGRAVLRSCAWGALPACAAVLASRGVARPSEALFRADAAGLAVGIAVAAFATVGLALLALRVTVAALGLALAHAVVATAEGAFGIAVLSIGTSLGALGLAALGRRLHCPSVAAGAVSAGVLWVACLGAWWADRLAASVPIEARTAVRQAVLDVDPFTAAATGAGFDRMHATTLYTDTIVASLPLEMPHPAETAGWWGSLGVLLLAASRFGEARRRGAAPATVGAST